ncbi:TRAP transporter small permease subunit [Aliamphritea spongicola]|nr:TRAP transporter small permease subunit [Aliamphritea spongicola]
MNRFVSLLLTGLICLVAIGQFVQVITRYVLEIPVMGLEESLLYPTLWLYVLGAVNASRENTHIRANVLEIFLKPPSVHHSRHSG